MQVEKLISKKNDSKKDNEKDSSDINFDKILEQTNDRDKIKKLREVIKRKAED